MFWVSQLRKGNITSLAFLLSFACAAPIGKAIFSSIVIDCHAALPRITELPRTCQANATKQLSTMPQTSDYRTRRTHSRMGMIDGELAMMWASTSVHRIFDPKFSAALIERRHVSGSDTPGPVVGPGLYHDHCHLPDPSFIMMIAWGLAPGDDPEAHLYLKLVILGCHRL